MNLLFLNALKGLRRKKVQMFGIIFMVLLSTAIYTTMNTSLDRLEDRYYHYLTEQNVEDFSFEPVVDYQKDVTLADLTLLKETAFLSLSTEEQTLLAQYEGCIANQNCETNTALLVQKLFTKYGANRYLESKKLDAIKGTYDFSYQLEASKMTKDDRYLIKAMPYLKDKKINKTYLVEGSFPQEKNEITVLPNFAKKNNLKIGDSYQVGDATYKIVGYTYAPDYIYPILSFSMPIFDEKYNNIIFMTEEGYQSFQGLEESVYVLKYNYDTAHDLKDYFSDENSAPNTLFKNEASTLTVGMDTFTRIGRINSLQLEFHTNRLFAQYFLYVLLSIAVFIILVITKKRIDDERLQIGVLKSLGYSRFSIAVSYLVYPVFGSLIGGILGYLLGISLNGWLTTLYVSYFTVPITGFAFNVKYLFNSILIPMVMLSILSYLIAIIMLRKKPLALLKEGSNLKVNWFSKVTTKLTKRLSFTSRFKYSLASRSFGKLFIVTLTSFCTGMLIVLTLIGMNLFNHMVDQSFEGITYKYMVAMNQLTIDTPTDAKEDRIFGTSMKVTGILDSTLKEKKLEKDDVSATLNGVDQNLNFLTIQDEKKKDLMPLLKDGKIIINKNMQEVLHLEIGDTMIFHLEGKEFRYQVAGVEETYLGFSVYIDRTKLTTDFGVPLSYTQKFSNDEKYKNMKDLDPEELQMIAMTLDVQDLKDNVYQQMETFNGSIYFVVAFASVMALIIIAVIANIVVEENKKTISLMKVMGYNNRSISSVVLNIYTPFVIIAYLLSIPTMIALLKWIITILVGDMNMTIPVTLSPVMAIVGLIGLLIAYYIAIYFSRRVLNKIPLAIALKRE